MKVRIPVDVDLEDRLIYGLTPLRLGYVAIAGLAALSAFRVAAPLPLRLPVCLLLLALAAAAGWAKYDGRHADRWVIDVFTYLSTNYRVAVAGPQLQIANLAWRRVELPIAAKPVPEVALIVSPHPTQLSEERMQGMRGS